MIAYELGYKGTLLDGQLQFNASWYLYQYDNYQDRVQSYNAGTQSNVDVVVNVDEAENMGIELEATWLATDNWTIGGNYSYADTEYKSDFFVLKTTIPIPTTLFPSRSANGSPTTSTSCQPEGRCTQEVFPEHKATMWSSYDFRFSAGYTAVGGSYSYTGKFQDSGLKRSLDEVPERTVWTCQ